MFQSQPFANPGFGYFGGPHTTSGSLNGFGLGTSTLSGSFLNKSNSTSSPFISNAEPSNSFSFGPGKSYTEASNDLIFGPSKSSTEASNGLIFGPSKSSTEASNGLIFGPSKSSNEASNDFIFGPSKVSTEASNGFTFGPSKSSTEASNGFIFGPSKSSTEASNVLIFGPSKSSTEASNVLIFGPSESSNKASNDFIFGPSKLSTEASNGFTFGPSKSSTEASNGFIFGPSKLSTEASNALIFGPSKSSTEASNNLIFGPSKSSTEASNRFTFGPSKSFTEVSNGSIFAPNRSSTEVSNGSIFAPNRSSTEVSNGSIFAPNRSSTQVSNCLIFGPSKSSTGLVFGPSKSSTDLPFGPSKSSTEASNRFTFGPSKSSTEVSNGSIFAPNRSSTQVSNCPIFGPSKSSTGLVFSPSMSSTGLPFGPSKSSTEAPNGSIFTPSKSSTQVSNWGKKEASSIIQTSTSSTALLINSNGFIGKQNSIFEGCKTFDMPRLAPVSSTSSFVFENPTLNNSENPFKDIKLCASSSNSSSGRASLLGQQKASENNSLTHNLSGAPDWARVAAVSHNYSKLNGGRGLGDSSGPTSSGMANNLSTSDVHDHVLAVAERPYLYMPPCSDLVLDDPIKMQVISKPMTTKTESSYRVTSSASRLKLSPLTAPCALNKKSLFDGIEESDISFDKLTLTPSRKRLVLRPKPHDEETTSSENSLEEIASMQETQTKSGSVEKSTPVSEEVQSEVPPNLLGVKLTRAGYYTEPSLQEMSKYIRADGTCMVPHLTIGRRNYGNVHYDCELDVAGMDLDALVHFHSKEVMIYPDDEQKPPVGAGLNRPAVVSLERVWPKHEGEYITDTNLLLQMDYEGKLRRICVKNNTEFIKYVPQTGSWVFRVKHFSKYGLTEDEIQNTLNLEKHVTGIIK